MFIRQISGKVSFVRELLNGPPLDWIISLAAGCKYIFTTWMITWLTPEWCPSDIYTRHAKKSQTEHLLSPVGNKFWHVAHFSTPVGQLQSRWLSRRQSLLDVVEISSAPRPWNAACMSKVIPRFCPRPVICVANSHDMWAPRPKREASFYCTITSPFTWHSSTFWNVALLILFTLNGHLIANCGKNCVHQSVLYNWCCLKYNLVNMKMYTN